MMFMTEIAFEFARRLATLSQTSLRVQNGKIVIVATPFQPQLER